MAERLGKWFLFSVLAALVPIAISCMMQKVHGYEFSIANSLAHGELLLITASLCAASAGELFAAKDAKRLGKIFAGGANMIILLFCTSLFTEVASSWASAKTVKADVVSNTSLFIFFCSIVCSCACIALAES